MVMRWQEIRQMDHLVSAPLWRHYDAADLFHLWIVRWTHTVQVASNLTTPNHRLTSRTCW